MPITAIARLCGSARPPGAVGSGTHFAGVVGAAGVVVVERVPAPAPVDVTTCCNNLLL